MEGGAPSPGRFPADAGCSYGALRRSELAISGDYGGAEIPVTKNGLKVTESSVHFDIPIPGCDIKSLMSKKYKWRKDWAYCYSLEKLMFEECIGSTLNLCCGFSAPGQVRADIDPQVRPDVVCDVRYLPFRDLAFDTVFCDPPYQYFNRPGWLTRLFDLAKKRVILDSLPIDWRAGGRWYRKWMILTRNGGLLVKTGAIYTRKDQQLAPEQRERIPAEDLEGVEVAKPRLLHE